MATIFLCGCCSIFAQPYHIDDLITNDAESKGIVFYVDPNGSEDWIASQTDNDKAIYVQQDTTQILYDTICKGEAYEQKGGTISTAETSIPENITASKLDRIVTRNIPVRSSSDTIFTVRNICQADLPFVWNNDSLYRDTILTTVLSNQADCDSVVVLHLHIIPNPISQLNIPKDICAGDSLFLSIGYPNHSSISLQHYSFSLGNTQKIFLPDSIECEPYGSSYRSFAHFSGFNSNATITSAEDILFTRIKIEHSALEDLRISLICPNGNSCKILPDQEHDGWSVSYTTMFRINLGLANRQRDNLTCDSAENPIGVPWNYIWSNNTTHGYQYAGGEFGYCYESANIHVQQNALWDNSNMFYLPHGYSYVVDSSNVANMSQIYHPQESFSNLIGCPLNGDWYIQVEDIQPNDNGYLVDWGIALNPYLLPEEYPCTERSILGPWVSSLSDSTFLITPPISLPHDTIVTYHAIVHNTIGCSFDTTFNIHFHIGNETIENDTIRISQLTYTVHDISFGPSTPTDTSINITYENQFGCDSIIHYHLHVTPSDTIYLTDTICENNLPHDWHGLTFYQAGTQTLNNISSQGGDSITVLTLYVIPTQSTTFTESVCLGNDYTGHGFVIPQDSLMTAGPHLFTRALTNQFGCDSIISLTINVIAIPTLTTSEDMVVDLGDIVSLWANGAGHYEWTPANNVADAHAANTQSVPIDSSMFFIVTGYNSDSSLVTHCNVSDTVQVLVRRYLDTMICESGLPLTWHDITFNESDMVDTIVVNPNGLDEALVLHVIAQPSLQVEIHAEVLENDLPYIFLDSTFFTAISEVPFHLVNAIGCDSVILFSLTVHQNSQREIDTLVCDYELPFIWNGLTLNSTGSYTISRQDHFGADSIITLNLNTINTSTEIASYSGDFCTDGIVELEVVSELEDYLWSTGETSQIIHVQESGTYTVTASNEQCSREARFSIMPCDGRLYLSNTITPSDRDGLNDYFHIQEYFTRNMEQFSIKIFDRWGECVFRSTDKNFRWYGDYNGNTIYNTTYIYVIEYRKSNGGTVRLNGSIIVL